MSGSNYSVRLLQPQDIMDVIDMKTAIDMVDLGYREAAEFPIINAPRRRADIIATNWRESIESEKQAGIYDPLQAGIISRDKIHELGAISSGQAPGRTSAEQITYHANNYGTAAADLAIAQRVFKTCKQMGRGIPLSLPRPGQQ